MSSDNRRNLPVPGGKPQTSKNLPVARDPVSDRDIAARDPGGLVPVDPAPRAPIQAPPASEPPAYYYQAWDEPEVAYYDAADDTDPCGERYIPSHVDRPPTQWQPRRDNSGENQAVYNEIARKLGVTREEAAALWEAHIAERGDDFDDDDDFGGDFDDEDEEALRLLPAPPRQPGLFARILNRLFPRR